MISPLLILDSLGTSEFLLILVVALIFFGPRKLPQLSRQIGKSLAEFRKASEDFKRTWEREVALETNRPEPEVNQTILPQDRSVIETTVERNQAIYNAASTTDEHSIVDQVTEPAQISGLNSDDTHVSTADSTQSAPARKQDWL